MNDWVSVKPLKDKFLENEEKQGRGYTSEVCMALGWRNTKGYADTSRLKRQLGIASKGTAGISERIDYDIAVSICRAMNIDPIDVEL